MKRSDYIGGSDAKRILDGEWHQLWLEKMGMVEPEDLSARFEVQLGIHTEKFHLDWLVFLHGFSIQQRGHHERMPGQPMIGASIDGWSMHDDTFIEVKHSNGRASRDSMIEWYQPQMAHMCNVFNRGSGILSYIAGNAAPEHFKMEPSKAYREALLELELAFWWHVENKEAPNLIPQSKVEAARAVARDVRIDDMRVVDMTLNNSWAALAIDYQLNKGAASLFEKAKQELKGLVEADVREARGHGVVIKRSKSGALLFSEGK